MTGSHDSCNKMRVVLLRSVSLLELHDVIHRIDIVFVFNFNFLYNTANLKISKSERIPPAGSYRLYVVYPLRLNVCKHYIVLRSMANYHIQTVPQFCAALCFSPLRPFRTSMYTPMHTSMCSPLLSDWSICQFCKILQFSARYTNFPSLSCSTSKIFWMKWFC